MYDTLKNIAKHLIAHSKISGRLDMRNHHEGKATKTELYLWDMSAFADDYISRIDGCYYEGWKLVDENTIEITHRKIDPNIENRIAPDMHIMTIEIPNEISPPSRCDTFFYNTPDDLNKYNIGDTLTLIFQDKHYVKKEYRKNEIQFKVMGVLEHNWRRPTKRLSLVPVIKGTNYKASDILYLDDTDRFKCLMIDLFGCNRIGYRGWKSRLTRITGITKKPYDFSVSRW